MNERKWQFRCRISAVALVISGLFFVLYPALRPFSDETSLQGAAAFGSGYWLLAHMLAMVAFTFLALGLHGLYETIRKTGEERLGYWTFVFGLVGVGFTLPFYGGEAFGLHAIGQRALQEQSAALISLAGTVRSGPGLDLFLLGLLLLAVAGILAAVTIWHSGILQKWSGVPLALALVLYVPQFFGSQPIRVIHGLLLTIGCVWIAVGVWKEAGQI